MAAADALSGQRILVAVSGSIAAVKVPALVSALVKRGAEVRCLLSPSAAQLVSPVALASLSRQPCVLEQDQWDHRSPRPLHIDLAEWADLVLLTPLSATTLARLVHGLSDTLLAATVMASRAPLLLAAAMNTDMWESLAVQRNWQQVQLDRRTLSLPPARDGLLACDRRGSGRMVEPELIELAAESLALHGPSSDLSGRRVLVTAGPSRESLDPARHLSNASSGLMGVLLAQAARLRGAEVTLLHGPLAVQEAWLEGVCCKSFTTSAELEALLQQGQPQADAVLMAAAVADQRLREPLRHKLPKHQLQQWLLQPSHWEPVPDLLMQLVQRRPPGQILFGFAAQSGDVLAEAEAKFVRKGCDLMFANPIDQLQAGFGSAANEGWLLEKGKGPERIHSCRKFALAHRLLDALVGQLDQAVSLPSATG